jgi:tetratricopeptide (TPR) repeat protein
MPSLDQLLPLLAAEPNDSFLRYAVAMEYAKLGRRAEAIVEFAELLGRDPGYVPGYFMAGRTAQQSGDYDAARSFYERGIAAARKAGDSHAADEMSEARAVLDELTGKKGNITT